MGMKELQNRARSWRRNTQYNKCIGQMSRLAPYRPLMQQRVQIKTERMNEDFQFLHANGVAFKRTFEQPPWKRSLHCNKLLFNFKGIRVKPVARDDEPGFPTHFR